MPYTDTFKARMVRKMLAGWVRWRHSAVRAVSRERGAALIVRGVQIYVGVAPKDLRHEISGQLEKGNDRGTNSCYDALATAGRSDRDNQKLRVERAWLPDEDVAGQGVTAMERGWCRSFPSQDGLRGKARADVGRGRVARWERRVPVRGLRVWHPGRKGGPFVSGPRMDRVGSWWHEGRCQCPLGIDG
jgi:hypothetical protein